MLWLTIAGANAPSEWLARGLGWVQAQFSALLTALHAPLWLHGLLVDGMFRTLAWVVAVMLPPMAIFFPLFTLLGYFFGGIPAVQKHFELVIIAILVLSLIPTIVGLLKAKFGKKKPAAEDTAETADAE